jgi:periplasmic protein TonB
VRSLLIAATLAFCGQAWSQPVDLPAEVAQFRKRLIAEAYQHSSYPGAAQQQRLEGSATVLVTFDAGGRHTAALKTSTGHEVLDRQALAVARRVAASLAVPQTLRGAEFSVDLPFAFSYAN